MGIGLPRISSAQRLDLCALFFGNFQETEERISACVVAHISPEWLLPDRVLFQLSDARGNELHLHVRSRARHRAACGARVPFDQLPDAIAYQDAGGFQGKIVVTLEAELE